MLVLPEAKHPTVLTNPFPHVVMRQVIDEDLCAQLVREFPPLNLVSRGKKPGSNRRFSYAARDVIVHESISSLWKQFVRQHISQPFLDVFLRLFRTHILELYPHFEQRYGRLDRLRAGVRGINNFDDVDILLDAQLCVNTPVTDTPTSVRGPHVDKPNKLFAGLLYLRADDDDSQGGDLQIFRLTDQHAVRFRGMSPLSTYIEPITVVPYERNTLVVFLNSWKSIHSVTARALTRHPRVFLNVIGEVRAPLFTTPQWRPRPWERLVQRLRQ